MRRTARAIIIEDDYVYLIKRITSKWGIYYSIPGGGIEQGETPEQAVIREIKEELNLDVQVISLINEYCEKEHDRYHYIFACKIIGGSFGKGTGEEYFDEKDDDLHIPYKLLLKDVEQEEILPKVCAFDFKKYVKGMIK